MLSLFFFQPCAFFSHTKLYFLKFSSSFFLLYSYYFITFLSQLINRVVVRTPTLHLLFLPGSIRISPVYIFMSSFFMVHGTILNCTTIRTIFTTTMLHIRILSFSIFFLVVSISLKFMSWRLSVQIYRFCKENFKWNIWGDNQVMLCSKIFTMLFSQFIWACNRRNDQN